jgi:hypothetical protein
MKCAGKVVACVQLSTTTRGRVPKEPLAVPILNFNFSLRLVVSFMLLPF